MIQEIEHLLAIHNTLGEGPIWSTREHALYWVDIKSNCFYRFYPATQQQERFDVGLAIGALAERASGGLVLATKNGFAFWAETLPLHFLGDPEETKPHTRFNDGAVDSKGRFWAGTMEEDAELAKEPEGSLYRLDPDRSIHRMERELYISNGIGWSPDNKTMYLTDSPRQVIYAYDFDLETGTIENRRAFIHSPQEEGVPDGLTIDSEGCIWSARWGGWKVTRYDPQGKVEREIRLPVAYPTSCAFGGEQLQDLFVTSARTALSEEEYKSQPVAGDLFRVKTDITGLAQPAYTG